MEQDLPPIRISWPWQLILASLTFGVIFGRISASDFSLHFLFAYYIYPIIFLGYFVVTLWSGWHLLSRFWCERWVAAAPLLLNLITFFLFFVFPGTATGQRLQFEYYKEKRLEVVRMIEQGQLQPDARGDVLLPEKYRYLTAGDEVMLGNAEDGIEVLFHSALYLRDGYTGLLYRVGDGPPPSHDFGGRIIAPRPVAPHWWDIDVSDEYDD